MPLQIHRARTSFQSSKFRSRECTWAEPGSNPTRALYTLSSRAWDPLHPLARRARPRSGPQEKGKLPLASRVQRPAPAPAWDQRRPRPHLGAGAGAGAGGSGAEGGGGRARPAPARPVVAGPTAGSTGPWARQRGQPGPPESATRWAQLRHSERPQGRAAASPGVSRHLAQPDSSGHGGCNTSTVGPDAGPGVPVLAAAISAQPTSPTQSCCCRRGRGPSIRTCRRHLVSRFLLLLYS